jgi:AcrR family transcriptional regulator
MYTERQKGFLKAAMKIVAEEGFGKLTVRNVTAAVGATEPSVYRQFSSKMVLLESLLDDLQSRVITHFHTFAEPICPPAVWPLTPWL